MESMTASAGELVVDRSSSVAEKASIEKSIGKLARWLQENDYRGYDTFDGLNARYLRGLTFESPILRTILLQGVRRFPMNVRPLLGVRRERSTKGMGFLARGFMRMHDATRDRSWADKATDALEWLMKNQAAGYSGACWGNHFDYQSRTFYLPKGTPTVVWTSLIGHAFLDGYEHFKDARYLKVAVGACEHIVCDLEAVPDGDTVCISYVPGQISLVHNANTLGASILARTSGITGEQRYEDLARKAMSYAAKYQRPDASWYYGEKANLHWVDNFHTGYVLDCFKHYATSTGDNRFTSNIARGYEYWKSNFFLSDGTPKYYANKTLPLDIQCSSQAIDTFVLFQDLDPEAIGMAMKVANWTMENMQDKSGYFYYRRYSPMIVNKTPTLHWGQATMMCALAGLYKAL
jgi:rhamnogalacturonyl hydrolase YesR